MALCTYSCNLVKSMVISFFHYELKGFYYLKTNVYMKKDLYGGIHVQTMFSYNWKVRDEWYRWCEEVDEAELLAERNGGVGGILHTLFHIIDVEWSWIRIMQGKEDFEEKFEEHNSLKLVRELDAVFHKEVEEFVRNWNVSMENNIVYDTLPDGRVSTDTWGEIMRHVIAHEIHHIGQLSVWSRELGLKPVSANFIGKGLVTTPRS